jgi:phosphoglycerate-specific signal transduction histidine kinase
VNLEVLNASPIGELTQAALDQRLTVVGHPMTSLSFTLNAYPRRADRVYPHSRFCLSDRYLCCTTNQRGGVDVAIISLDQLIERTA